jgi:hypothetical protein
MSNDETIAIVFILFIIGAFILYRKWYSSRKKVYIPSDEIIGGYRLRIVEHNPRTNDAQVVLHCSHPFKPIDLERIEVEFIDPKRNFLQYELTSFIDEDISLRRSDGDLAVSAKFYKSDFLRGVRNNEIKLYRFRFNWVLTSGSKLKTHEMAISARYIFFKPDSGFFN